MCTQNTDIFLIVVVLVYTRYTSSIFAVCARGGTCNPSRSGAAGRGAQKLLPFFWLLARIDMDRYANATNLILKMPPALLHCGGMHLCAFFPRVFCNYGRITNGLLSLHTHTLTENQFALHVIVASAVGCLPTYLRLSAQSLISINYGNCWRKKKKRHVRKYQSFMARFGSPLKLSTNANHLWLAGYG